MLAVVHALSAITWDPQLRGFLIVLTAVVVLPGSVYLLLATNNGLRLGFLLAVAGLTGWLFVLNVVWLGYGIGYKGSANGWIVKEIVTGDLAGHSAVRAVAGNPADPSTVFPNGWHFLPTGNPLLAPAVPVADKALTPPAAGVAPSSAFPAPFTSTQDYVLISGYDKGGHNYLVNLFGYKIFWRIRHHQMFIKHQPHYLVIRVQPSVKSITLAGAAATLPSADNTKPLTSVVMQRNVGSLRLPPILLGTSSLIIFLLTCFQLHERDKAIERRRKGSDPGLTGSGERRELQPA